MYFAHLPRHVLNGKITIRHYSQKYQYGRRQKDYFFNGGR